MPKTFFPILIKIPEVLPEIIIEFDTLHSNNIAQIEDRNREIKYEKQFYVLKISTEYTKILN